MRDFSIFLVLIIMLGCSTGWRENVTPNPISRTYFRIKLNDACNYVSPEKRTLCLKRDSMERTFYFNLAWVAGRTPIGLPIWSSIPRADYWHENYFSKVTGGWDFRNQPSNYLPGNCVYKVPLEPGPGEYLFFLYPNVNSDMSLRLKIMFQNSSESSNDQGVNIIGTMLLKIPREIKPGESITFDFDPYDLKKYTYSIDPTPETEDDCAIDPGFGGT